MDEKELAKELGRRFLQRRSTKARQFADGHYEPVHEPWTLHDLMDHIAGRATWGHYLVDDDNLCRVAAFDIDLRQKGQWRPDFWSEYVDCFPRTIWTEAEPTDVVADLRTQLRCLGEGLARRLSRRTSLPVAVAYSGYKGVHVYAFLPAPTPAVLARATMAEVLESFECFELYRGDHQWRHRDGYRGVEIEVFPKQDTVRAEGGLGNLMRLPLGVHQKSHQPGYFVDLNTGYDTLSADDPALALTAGSIRGEAHS